jgi:hypothetical protein
MGKIPVMEVYVGDSCKKPILRRRRNIELK